MSSSFVHKKKSYEHSGLLYLHKYIVPRVDILSWNQKPSLRVASRRCFQSVQKDR